MRRVLVVLLLCTAGLAQDLPNAPSFTPPSAKERAAFVVAMTAVQLGPSSWDAETTVTGLRRGCVEQNTLFIGNHPSRTKLYARNLGGYALMAGLDYFIFTHAPKKWRWLAILPNAVLGASHAYAAFANDRTVCR